MQNDNMTLSWPEGFENYVHLSRNELAHHMRLMAAIKMFELGKISAGRAAELAELSRPEFIETASRYGINMYNYSREDLPEELSRDINTLREFVSR